ncbi:hypothetical protein F2Q68_00002400 [Brassica cretica]|uniref:Uncharacterized protein n=1 Tax=Brassica cretica TaxID=69181 RepID=A0A8S9JPC6_BRACR|nr:hypothetical protein F2Q68_00002400 [Brassica cretica]
MATFSSDKPVEEEDVQTEEADPAETTEEEGRTEEDEQRAFLILIQSILVLVSLWKTKSPTKELRVRNLKKIRQWSDQTVNRGSPTFTTDQNRRLTPQVMMPIKEQITRGDHQTVNHGSTTFSSDSLETQSPFQQQQRLTTDQKQSLRYHQQHPMVNQLADIEGLLNQKFVPRPLFRPAQTYFVEQPHLFDIALSVYRYYPYMRPEANHLNLRMPHFRNNQMFTLTSPSGQPRSFALLHDQFNPYQRFVLSLDDALVFGPILEMDHPQPQQKREPLDFPIDMICSQDSPNAQQRFNLGQHFVYPLDMIHHQASSPIAAAATNAATSASNAVSEVQRWTIFSPRSTSASNLT